MAIPRRKLSLFEAITKAPQVQYPARKKGIFSRLRGGKDAEPVPIVAEPLTEEQAAAELAAQRAADSAKRVKEPGKKRGKKKRETPAERAAARPVAAEEQAGAAVPAFEARRDDAASVLEVRAEAAAPVYKRGAGTTGSVFGRGTEPAAWMLATGADAAASMPEAGAEAIASAFQGGTDVAGPVLGKETDAAASFSDRGSGVAASAPEDAVAAARLPVRMIGGRLVLSLGTVGCLVAAAAVCVLLLSSYVVGRKSAGSHTGPATAAATINREMPRSPTPLLPALMEGATVPKAEEKQETPDAHLSYLLEQPPARRAPVVSANVPAKSVDEPVASSGEAAVAESLHHLQIESFLITRQRNGQEVARDLAEVRRFLAERGVATFARQLSNGYVLYSQQAFAIAPEAAGQRDAFRKKIESLGREYRKSGGLYEFKGCDFVHQSRTKTGRPVQDG